MTIKLFIIGSDDNDLTQEMINAMPEVDTLPEDAEEIIGAEYYQPAYDLGYKVFATEDEEYFLVK